MGKSITIPDTRKGLSSSPPRKIVVAGVSGCGKTTLGRQLARAWKVKCVDLDDLHWLPGWKSRGEDEFFAKIETELSSDSWVVSGNYSRAQHLIWPQAEMVIWLDLPLSICLWRTLKRTLSRVFTGETCCNGNYETIGRLFRRDSILRWVWNSYPRRKKAYTEFFANHHDALRLVRLRNHRAVKEFVESLPKQY